MTLIVRKMDYITVLGFVAGTLTTVSFLPQVIKTWKTKSTEDISLYMYILFCMGVFSWLAYGIFLNSYPIIIANATVLILGITVLGLKIKYG